ncbi:phospholipase B1, membrane-associated-like [Rhizophagus clarus]|uniref:Phospholipase B1, membrane-associated-like n=1 Tax=Rhizophagus clarus TaxID=94130 RepID=A0A8H3L5Y0_9GLOM|nr:phospholipase B1, membrane-associated-like [Rhizophagus clarus]
MVSFFVLLQTVRYVLRSRREIRSRSINKNDIPNGKFVKDITQCPKLKPRQTPPKSVHDLRIDDIKVIMALGDSITAGFGAKGHHTNIPIDIHNLHENRGVSFSIGGDPDAVTIANFIKHYSPELIGSSTGDHLVELCYGLICPPYQYKPNKDRFNAAQSGMMISNLTAELNYLLDQLYKEPIEVVLKSYKYLTLFIGSNDICFRCSNNLSWLTSKQFEDYLMLTLETIRREIPNTVVNLLGVFNVSQVYNFHKEEYCKGWGLIAEYECSCAFAPGILGSRNRMKMDETAMEYNKAIRNVVNYYASRKSNSFAVMYQEFDIDLTTFPVEGLSNIDCFHPSTKSHDFIAKTFWNNLVLPMNERRGRIEWEDDVDIRCFEENDRINTNINS